MKPNNKKGFTLLEILLATSIIAIMATCILGFLIPFMRANYQIKSSSETQLALDTAWELLTKDIECAQPSSIIIQDNSLTLTPSSNPNERITYGIIINKHPNLYRISYTKPSESPPIPTYADIIAPGIQTLSSIKTPNGLTIAITHKTGITQKRRITLLVQ